MVYKTNETESVRHLFENWDETVIWSALDGIMGEIYTTSERGKADSAFITLGEFLFFAGEPDEELVRHKPHSYKSSFALFVPRHDENEEKWCALFEKVYGNRAKRITRHSTVKTPHSFDLSYLNECAAALPSGYCLKMMDEDLYNECKKHKWCKDFVSQYPTWESYSSNVIGVMCLYDGEIAAGMSAFSHYNGGIELELATREDHRRKGLARAVSAKMISECAKRGLYPSWDAANDASITIAKSFGYTLDRDYTAYEISNY